MVVDTIGPEVLFSHQLFPIRFHLYTQRFSLFSVYILDRLIDSGTGFRICSNSQLCFNDIVTVITDTTTRTKVTTIVSSNSRNKIAWKVLIHLLYPALFDIIILCSSSHLKNNVQALNHCAKGHICCAHHLCPPFHIFELNTQNVL